MVFLGTVGEASLLLRVRKSLLSHELSRFRKFLCVVQVQSDGSSVKKDKVIIVIFLFLPSPRSDLCLDLTPPVAVSGARLTVTIIGLETDGKKVLGILTK